MLSSKWQKEVNTVGSWKKKIVVTIRVYFPTVILYSHVIIKIIECFHNLNFDILLEAQVCSSALKKSTVGTQAFCAHKHWHEVDSVKIKDEIQMDMNYYQCLLSTGQFKK